MFGDFLGSCNDNCFLNQTSDATFWATFGKTWATFYFTSGHTGDTKCTYLLDIYFVPA